MSGATVEVFKEGNTDGTALYSGTTGTNGVATVSSVPYGKYDVVIKEKDHKTKTVTGVIVNNATETIAVKITA